MDFSEVVRASRDVAEAPGRLVKTGRLSTLLTALLPEEIEPVVAFLSGSEYELHQHRPLARAAGLTEADIAAIGEGDYRRLEPRLAAVAEFAAAIVRRPNPPDEVLARVRRHVSDRELVNIVLAVGCYMSLARLIAVTGIELDENRLEALPTGLEG